MPKSNNNNKKEEEDKYLYKYRKYKWKIRYLEHKQNILLNKLGYLYSTINNSVSNFNCETYVAEMKRLIQEKSNRT